MSTTRRKSRGELEADIDFAKRRLEAVRAELEIIARMDRDPDYSGPSSEAYARALGTCNGTAKGVLGYVDAILRVLG